MPRLTLTLVTAALLALPALAAAAPYDALYVFGDSLSDRGNLADAFGTSFPNPPSYHNSFTNGDVAIARVAAAYGLADDPSLWLSSPTPTNPLTGTSYAVGGATAQASAVGGIADINLPQQISAYLAQSGGTADTGALYTLFIGGNDVTHATMTMTDEPAITAAVSSELNAITQLKAAGARNFLVVNVPDVGSIPLFAQEHPDLAGEASTLTTLYNQDLASGLATVSGVNLVSFNLFTYEKAILANAARFGITDTADFCYTNAPFSAATTAACGAGAANIGHFAYWNDVHPTKQVHALIAKGIEQALAGVRSPSPVPEPAIWALLVGGFGMIGGTLRRGRERIAASEA
ncbi:SGNH/GDSL hydrolase family protein [Sphingomonas bacterium]|uniref:SGNH/GDSL hydrolase family protein n=1 Tax=Sphingomonas bacterium TaxID=1895847 RepID=UPI001576E5F8|nr:SGNH/GDSL hydrolase family protein [Sphingomonas bacterium]